jgi:hypothetical protein
MYALQLETDDEVEVVYPAPTFILSEEPDT